MRSRPLLACWSAVSALAVLSALSASAGTDALQAQAPSSPPMCATILTDEEVAKALGRSIAAQVKKTFDDGSSMCDWAQETALSGIITVGVGFMDARSIKAIDRSVVESTGTRWPPTVAEFFDHAVKHTIGLAQAKPELIPEIGVRAALFERVPMQLIVERRDGVATLVGVNVTRAQMLALGRAVLAP